MIKISPNNLQQIKDDFLSIFDIELINEIENFDLSGVKIGPELNSLLSNAHPLALKWESFCSDIRRSETEGRMIVGPETTHILQLYALLLSIRNIENFQDRIISRLSKKSEYYSTYFEIIVASSYIERGYSVEIIKETPNEGKKSFDFLVSTPLGKVMVEAKSLENPDDKQIYIHEELARRIRKTLLKHKQCYIVSIRAFKILELSEINDVIIAIDTDLSHVCLDTINKSIENISISYGKIGEWGEIYNDVSIDQNKLSEFGHISWDLVHDNGKILGHRNPTGFELFPVSNVNRLNTIIENLKTAKRQLTYQYPSIVHIEINGNQNVFHQTMDQCFDSIYRKLSGDFKAINAVVFEKQYYNPKPLNEYDILTYQSQVIAGRKSKFPLPEDFSVCLEKPFFNSEDIEHARTISFDVKLEDFDYNLYRNLFWQSTPDGLNQVRAYIVPNGMFRFEVIQKKFGRRFIEEELSIIKHIFIESGKEWNNLMYTWDKNSIILMINYQNGNHEHIKTKKYR
jgi:hypothetical protein